MSVISDAVSAPNPPGSPLQSMRSKRDLLCKARGQMLDTAQGEARALHASEQREWDSSTVTLAQFDERIGELKAQEDRMNIANAARVAAGETSEQRGGGGLMGGYHTGGGLTYDRGPQSPSFFRDLIHAQRGDLNAADRLRRNNVETGLEQRALGNTNQTGGSGGEFAPPLWITDDFVALARPGRVTAELFTKQELPHGISSVNIPKVQTGTTAGVQSTQNTALSQTDLTSSSLSAGVVTIGGKQVVSQQLLDQSGTAFDRVILEDLAADYARQVGLQVLTGTGVGGQLRGYLQPASANVQTWTTATPTGAGFYGQLAKLQGAINASRFLPPDTLILSPRRWAWFASSVDSQNRPLVLPTTTGQNFNTMAATMGSLAAGHVGSVLGMDAFVDANIPLTQGAGANQDTVLMCRRSDIWLWESPLQAEAFTAPYADSMGVLFRCFGYLAMVPDRYLSTLGQLVGSGLVPPVFAS